MFAIWPILLGILGIALAWFLFTGRKARPAILDPGINPNCVDPDNPECMLPETADPSAVSADSTGQPVVQDSGPVLIELPDSQCRRSDIRKHYKTCEDIEPEQVELLEMISRSMPELPRLSINLLPVLCQTGTGMKEIAQIVERDQAVASRLMRWVNSAVFGLEGKVESVSRAVILLGLDTVRSAVVYDSFKRVLNPKGLAGLDIERIWSHCAAVSVTAKHFGRMVRGIDPDVAATAGLLHDLGLLLMLIIERMRLEEVLDALTQSNGALIDSEDELIGFNHQIIGECFCRAWGLPEVIANGIGKHHNPMDDTASVLSTLIWLSDYMVSRIGFACPEGNQQYFDESDLAEVTRKLGINGKLELLITPGLMREVQKTSIICHWDSQKEKSTIARNLLSPDSTA